MKIRQPNGTPLGAHASAGELLAMEEGRSYRLVTTWGAFRKASAVMRNKGALSEPLELRIGNPMDLSDSTPIVVLSFHGSMGWNFEAL